MKIYETPNPFFLSDIFVFAEVEEIGLCYIKVNCFNRIEEIGFDIQRRMCRNIGEIMKSAKKATKIHRHIFTSIDIEYWWKIHNQWIYGGLAEDRKNNFVILPKDDWRKGECVNEDTIGQFSGLPDKNGKEIYKDDIVRWEHDNKLYVIRFQAGMFYASVEECNERIYGGFPLHAFTETSEEGFQCEIVGNIHDNPELLKKAQNFSPTCATCNSYDDGKCTNFGKEVKAEDSCKYYQSDVIEYTCQQCGRKYEIIDSDAGNLSKSLVKTRRKD